MDKLIRFRTSSYEGFGLLDVDTVYESSSLGSTVRGAAHSLSSTQLLVPTVPTKIVCVGRNYRDHAKELNNPVPAEPLIFLKPPSSLIASGEAIVYPELSESVHHEAELGVVISKLARNVRADDAWQYALGFTCVNDVTARDLQKKDGQWTRGKGFDTFCPCGPHIVRREDVDFDSLRVKAVVDGEVRQDGPVRDMIFSVPTVIAYVTQFMTLEPGDLIATGTPAGVGPLLPGQTVSIEIEGVGVLRNRVVKAQSAATT